MKYVHEISLIVCLNYRDNKFITVPTYGFPQITAQINLINDGFNKNGSYYGEIDSIGIELYDNLESLDYVKDYENATSEWIGFPILYNVPPKNILVGLQGIAESQSIIQMAENVVQKQLGGIMVWYASVWDATRQQNGLTYYPSDPNDATRNMNQTGSTWSSADKIIEGNNQK